MTLYFTRWVNKCSAKDSVYLVSLHMAEFEGNPENQGSVVVLFFFYLLLVTSLRSQFSLVYLCVQFVFSAAALHFLVRWITPWSKGVYIPSLHFFCENNPNLDQFFSRPLADEDLFFLTIMGSYTSENNCSGQWGRESTGHMYNINGLVWLSFWSLTSFCGTYVSLPMSVV